MKRFRISLLLVLLLLPVSSVQALDLAEMQAMASQSREVIKRYQLKVERAAREVDRVRSGYYPSLDIGYLASSLNNPRPFEYRDNSSVYGSVSMNLFAGFRDRYGIESARLLRQVEEIRLNGLRQDIQLNVALRYLSVYESQASLQVAEDVHTTLKRIYGDGQERLEVGLIGENELLKFKVDLDNAHITVQKRQADLRKNVRLLGREINMRSISLETLNFAEFEALPEIDSVDVCRGQMLERRSELLALDGLMESSTAQVRAEQAAYYPQLDVVGSYSHYDDDFVTGSGELNNEELRGGLVLSLNLFDGFSRESVISKARLTVREIAYDREELKNSLEAELDNLFIDYEVSLANVEVSHEDIQHAEENLRITQLKYKEGLQREIELLDAVTNLSRARYNEVAVIRALFANAFQITRMVEGFPHSGPSS
jgi:outer membrane protein TolC